MRIGILGYGNMGRAFALGLKDKYDILAFDKDIIKKDTALQDGVGFASSTHFLMENVDVLLLSIKPQDLINLSIDIKNKSIISILAGISMNRLKDVFKEAFMTRIMPNLGVLKNKGVIAFHSEDPKKEELKSMISLLGNVYELEEKYFDAFTAIGGSGPALIASIVEAMRLSGVYMGLNKDISYDIVINMIFGTLELLKEYSEEELILKVSSPGGTTIEGIYNIEKSGIRGALMESFIKAYEKSKKL